MMIAQKLINVGQTISGFSNCLGFRINKCSFKSHIKRDGDAFTRYIGNNVSYINIVALKNISKVAAHNKGFNHVR